MEITKFAVIDSRPSDVPADWIVFNAPRPLYGHKEWQGEFYHGRFFAAVDPHGEYADRFMKNNVSLDGWVVEYYEKDAAIKQVIEFYKVTYPGESEAIADLNEKELLDAFYHHFGKTIGDVQ